MFTFMLYSPKAVCAGSGVYTTRPVSHFKQFMAKKVGFLKILLDFLILLLIGLPALFLQEFLTPFQRGFYCDDESIRYPYKDSTVSTLVLFLAGCGIPIIMMLVFEALRLIVENKVDNYARQHKHFLGRIYIHRFVWRCYVYIGFFVIGGLATGLLTQVGKYSIGRLRPHFLSVCQPDWTKINCTNYNYVENAHCTADKDKFAYELKDARLSFPSGHASFSFYFGTYLVLYLQGRVVWSLYSSLARPLLHLIIIGLAFFTALSRTSDYKHHWADVLIGSIMGIIIGTVTAHVAEFFQPKSNSHSSMDTTGTELPKLQAVNPAKSDNPEYNSTLV